MANKKCITTKGFDWNIHSLREARRTLFGSAVCLISRAGGDETLHKQGWWTLDRCWSTLYRKKNTHKIVNCYTLFHMLAASILFSLLLSVCWTLTWILLLNCYTNYVKNLFLSIDVYHHVSQHICIASKQTNVKQLLSRFSKFYTCTHTFFRCLVKAKSRKKCELFCRCCWRFVFNVVL